jgi:hypothetical protein
VTGRRRGQRRKPGPSERQLAVVRRARDQLRELPTAKVRRIQDLLERVLAEPELDRETVAELERILGPEP